MNILGIGPLELVLIGGLVFVLFGPQELPRIMGQIGRTYREIQKATSGLTEEFTRTLQAEVDAVSTTVKSEAEQIHSAVRLDSVNAPSQPTPPPTPAPGLTVPAPTVAPVTQPPVPPHDQPRPASHEDLAPPY